MSQSVLQYAIRQILLNIKGIEFKNDYRRGNKYEFFTYKNKQYNYFFIDLSLHIFICSPGVDMPTIGIIKLADPEFKQHIINALDNS